MGRFFLFILLLLPLLSLPLAAEETPPPLPVATPAAAGMDAKKLARIDHVVNDAIKRCRLPGAVVVVLRRGKVVFRKAYGDRSKLPQRQKMTLQTVFDLASLTKPIATAMCIMILLEQGKLRLSDPVHRYLPAFNSKSQRQITIRHLLLHTSGLIPDNPIRDYQDGKERAWERLLKLDPIAEPGSKFMYSDVGFILLGKIVENISGETLDVFAAKHVFTPLGMKDTTYRPGKELVRRAAPAEKRNGKWMQGEVHDPRAYRLGGVAGHAGLFSSADDLTIFCQMLLNRGQFKGKRILSPLTVRLMTKAHEVPRGLRGLGWDIDTAYSSNRGELFPIGGFGHTGFTGTSIWIDPGTQTAIIFLSNRVHPNGKGNVIRVRNQVATIVAASIVTPLADDY